jgi:hypothetical protein
MEILERKVMARFGQKLIWSGSGGFRHGSIDLAGLEIPKKKEK